MCVPDAYPNDWAKLIHQLRQRHGWTQKVMGDLIGVNRMTISRWENGHIDNVESVNVRALVDKAGADSEAVADALMGAERGRDDELVQYVRGSDLSATDKAEIIDYIAERRDEEAAKLRRDIDLMLRKRRPPA
jgi:transcriptional regulator with XRE-family HTH domain